MLLAIFESTLKMPSPNTSGPNMAQATPANLLAWNNGHPLLVPINFLAIPQENFKVLPKYDVSGKPPYEHY